MFYGIGAQNGKVMDMPHNIRIIIFLSANPVWNSPDWRTYLSEAFFTGSVHPILLTSAKTRHFKDCIKNPV
jgi:hypothetical protein